MLHRKLNSEIALEDTECQILGLWTTILGAWTTIRDHLPDDHLLWQGVALEPIVVLLDCADPDHLARFWAAALGLQAAGSARGLGGLAGFPPGPGFPGVMEFRQRWSTGTARAADLLRREQAVHKLAQIRVRHLEP
jgi:hypothetical protein